MFDGNAVEGESRRLVNKLLLLFNKGKDEVGRSSRIGKGRLDLSSLKRDRELVFEQLGEEVYKRHKAQTLSLSGLEPFFAELDLLTSNLSSKEKELEYLKGDGISERQLSSSS